MTTYWDFRLILNVDPVKIQRCVAKNVRSGKPCGNDRYWIGVDNLERAGEILDLMDQTQSLSKCQAYLEQLVKVVVCGSPHRTHAGTLKNLVTSWNKAIEAYVASRDDKVVRTETVLSAASSEVFVFGGRNGVTNDSVLGTTGRLQQVASPYQQDPLPTSVGVPNVENISHFNKTVISTPEIELKTQARATGRVPKEKALGQDNNLPAPIQTYVFGGANQKHEHAYIFDFNRDFKSTQEDIVPPNGISKGEPIPLFTTKEETQPLAKLKIEGHDLVTNDEEQVSPLESDYEPEDSHLDLPPTIHSVKSEKSNDELDCETEPISASQFKLDEGTSMAPETINSSQDELQGSEIFENTFTQSTEEGIESHTTVQAVSNCELPAEDHLSVFPGKESIPISSECAIPTIPRANNETDLHLIDNSSSVENLEEVYSSGVTTTQEKLSDPFNDNGELLIQTPIEVSASLKSPDFVVLENISSNEDQIVVATDHSNNPQKRQTRSTTKELLEAASKADHLAPLVPAESYGFITILSTERRSSQRFADHRNASQVKPRIEEPYRSSFDGRLESESPVTKKRTTVMKDRRVQEVTSSASVVLTREEIPWENDRGIVKKEKGVRTSMKGFISKMRGLRSSSD